MSYFRPDPKDILFESQDYLRFLRERPICAACGRHGSEVMSIVPAHQNLGYGKMGGKVHDSMAVNLCSICHGDEHFGTVTFWKKQKKNPERIIIELLTKYLISKTHRGRIRF